MPVGERKLFRGPLDVGVGKCWSQPFASELAKRPGQILFGIPWQLNWSRTMLPSGPVLVVAGSKTGIKCKHSDVGAQVCGLASVLRI